MPVKRWDGTITGTCEWFFGIPALTAPKVKKVIFHDPATVVYWEDGTKTVVKCGDGDIYDSEKGFALAVCKKVYGSYTNFEKQMNKKEEKE